MKTVWYVAYGSNLGLRRFDCYLSGGRPAGGTRQYVGCRDTRDPVRVVSVEAPGGLVFAGRSRVWGGGMAFYDPDAPGKAACRAYLVTLEQFADIVAQEMRRPPGGAFAEALAQLVPQVTSVHVMGAGRYETVVRLGTLEGVPMLTVTHSEVRGLDLAAPTSPYLRWISAGLREAHGWDEERIADYLIGAPGVSQGWTRERLAALAGQETGLLGVNDGT